MPGFLFRMATPSGPSSAKLQINPTGVCLQLLALYGIGAPFVEYMVSGRHIVILSRRERGFMLGWHGAGAGILTSPAALSFGELGPILILGFF
jgi:hypothetical protein